MYTEIPKVHSYSVKEMKLIADYLNQKKKCVIIELSGTPNAGKTSALKTLERILIKHFKIPAKVMYEAANNCPIKNKYSPQFDYWTVCETIKNLIYYIDGGFRLIICERGVFDAVIWATVYHLDGFIDQNQLNVLSDFYLYPEWASLIGYTFIMKCDTRAAIKRESFDGPDTAKSPIVNKITLDKINNALSIALENNKENIIDYSIFDTSDLDQEEINKIFVSSVFNYLMRLRNEPVQKSG
jgi:uncharacterized protein YfkK (UPF0435 family)